jgi:hypothetical protein
LGKQAAYIFLSLAIKHGQWRKLSRVPAALATMDQRGTAQAAAAVPAGLVRRSNRVDKTVAGR